MILAALLAGCSPRLDWRDARIAGPGLTALFPCKPASQVRRVVLAGASVEMSMHACTVDDVVYAVAAAQVAEPARVGPALAELRAAAARNLGAEAPPRSEAQVRGATPNPESGHAVLEGRLSDGRKVREAVTVFARGTWVVQATVLGPAIDADASEAFFGGLRFAE